jgi:hypothetical protein
MAELKTAAHWRDRKYVFISRAFCPACRAEVELWQPKKGSMVQLDPTTYETHFSSCPKARTYRIEQQREAGVL